MLPFGQTSEIEKLVYPEGSILCLNLTQFLFSVCSGFSGPTEHSVFQLHEFLR